MRGDVVKMNERAAILALEVQMLGTASAVNILIGYTACFTV
jgi:hypothetical protein